MNTNEQKQTTTSSSADCIDLPQCNELTSPSRKRTAAVAMPTEPCPNPKRARVTEASSPQPTQERFDLSLDEAAQPQQAAISFNNQAQLGQHLKAALRTQTFQQQLKPKPKPLPNKIAQAVLQPKQEQVINAAKAKPQIQPPTISQAVLQPKQEQVINAAKAKPKPQIQPTTISQAVLQPKQEQVINAAKAKPQIQPPTISQAVLQPKQEQVINAAKAKPKQQIQPTTISQAVLQPKQEQVINADSEEFAHLTEREKQALRKFRAEEKCRAAVAKTKASVAKGKALLKLKIKAALGQLKRKVATTTPQQQKLTVYLKPLEHPQRKLTDEQQLILTNAIVMAINASKLDKLRISNIDIRDGYLSVDCANRPTMNWLLMHGANLNNYEGPELATSRADSASLTYDIRMTLPSAIDISNMQIKQMLATQNGYKTHNWRLQSRLDLSCGGVYLHWNIDEFSARSIAKNNCFITNGVIKVPVTGLKSLTEVAKHADQSAKVYSKVEPRPIKVEAIECIDLLSDDENNNVPTIIKSEPAD